MNVRIVGALVVLLASIGALSAQGPVPGPLPPSPPLIVQPTPAQPTLPDGPVLAPEALYASSGGNLFYAEGEYLLWNVRGFNIPNNVSAVPVGLIAVDLTDLFQNTPGGVATPGGLAVTGYAPISIATRAEFGGDLASRPGSLNGSRITLGLWGNPNHSLGLEASAIILERGTDQYVVDTATRSNQFLLNTGFNRNVFLIQGGNQQLVNTFPVFVTREVASRTTVNTATSLYGGELHARGTSLKIGSVDVGWLAGARYLLLKDDLGARSDVRFFQPPGIPPTGADLAASISSDLTFSTLDRIRIWNNFIGAQVGVDAMATFGGFFVSSRLKLAAGPNIQYAQLDSATQVINRDPQRQSPPSSAVGGGLLVGTGDVGNHTRTVFSVIPEVNLKVGYTFTDWLRVHVGYDGLYMSNMARSGISSTTNSLNTNITAPGGDVQLEAVQPAFRFRSHDAWVQGFNCGFELMY